MLLFWNFNKKWAALPENLNFLNTVLYIFNFTKKRSKRVSSPEELFEHLLWVAEVERVEPETAAAHVEVVIATAATAFRQTILAVFVIDLPLLFWNHRQGAVLQHFRQYPTVLRNSTQVAMLQQISHILEYSEFRQ